jgi:twinkle protein
MSRHGQHGLYALADLPQRPSVAEKSIGTGWWELDQIWRIYDGQFTIVTGVAGHGKSTLLLNVVCNVAREYGTKSFLYVPENESRIREKMRGIWGSRPGFDEFSRDQCIVQSAIPSNIDQKPRTLDRILQLAEIAIERDGTDIVLIDPWNELERAKNRDELMTDYIGWCLMYLKNFSRMYDVSVMLVAHPTKAGVAEGKTPSLSDIEGSMNWYNKCDNGLVIVRDDNLPTAKVISAKVREYGAGKRGVCHFFVDEQTGQFTPQPGAVS